MHTCASYACDDNLMLFSVCWIDIVTYYMYTYELQ